MNRAQNRELTFLYIVAPLRAISSISGNFFIKNPVNTDTPFNDLFDRTGKNIKKKNAETEGIN